MTVARLAFIGGALTIEDRTLTPPRTWRVEAVELHATDASTVAGAPPGAATLSAVAAGAPVSLSVTDLRLSPLHLRATLNARGVDATLAALILPPRSPLSPTHGTVSVSATIDHDAVTGSLIALDAGFTDVELHRPEQASAFLSAPAVRLTVEGLRVRPGGIELARLAVDAGAIGLEDTRLASSPALASRWRRLRGAQPVERPRGATRDRDGPGGDGRRAGGGVGDQRPPRAARAAGDHDRP